jgi:hypothetical protein
MSSNRIHYFIRSVLQNSKLNREKIVKNKKIYSETNKIKHNLILKRNFNTNSHGLPPPNGNNNNYWVLFTSAALVVYFYKKH